MDFAASLKGIYYSIEDKYYSFLDFLESKKIPVYKIVDPIDEVIPSFALFCLIILLLAFGMLWIFAFSQQHYSLNVQVASMEDNKPVKDARIDFKYWADGGEIMQAFAKTDNDGKFSVAGLSGNLNFEFSAKITGFKDYKKQEKISFETTGLKLLLEKKPVLPPASEKKIIVMDASGTLKKKMQNKDISISFSCSSGRSLEDRDTMNPEQLISAADVSLCGTIEATVSVSEYAPLTLELVDPQTYFDLVKEPARTGNLTVLVKSKQNSALLKEIKLTAYNSNASPKGVGRTGDDGSYSFELEAGNYYVHAIDDMNGTFKNIASEVVSVGAEEDTLLEIFMEKNLPSTQRVLRIKVLDSNSRAPIEGAKVYYSVDGILGSSPISTAADGIAEYAGFDANDDVVARIVNTGYVTRFSSTTLRMPSDSNYDQILLVRQSATPPLNYAVARVYVRDELGSLTEGATAKIFNKLFPSMPLVDETDSGGLADFGNEALPAGDYNAFAEKDFPIYSSVWSETSHLGIGDVKDFNLTLVIGVANLAAKVVNYEGAPIADANVAFYESDTGDFPVFSDKNSVTALTGMTAPFGFKVSKKVKIRASKAGFMDSYMIVDNLSRADVTKPLIVTVALYPTGYASEFTMNLREDLYPENCIGELSPTQKKISANTEKKYGMMFDVIVPETTALNNVKSHVRADKDSVRNEASAIIKVSRATPYAFGPMRFADLNLSDFYGNDQNQVTDPAKNAKLANLSLGNLSSNVRSFCVTFLVTKQPSGKELEIKYSSKSDEKSLPTYSEKLTVGQSFCRTGCPLFDYEFSICPVGPSGSCVSDREYIEPNSNTPYAIKYMQNYSLSYNVTNKSRQNIAQDFNAVFGSLTEFLDFGSLGVKKYYDSIIPARMGQFANNASTGTISVPLKAVLKTTHARMGFELDSLHASGLADTNGFMLFDVNAFELRIDHPAYLMANRPNQQFEILVSDRNTGMRLQNAEVRAKITDSAITSFDYSLNDVSEFTNSNGIAFFTLNEAFDASRKLSILVTGPGYDEGTVFNIPFSNAFGPVEEFACVSFSEISRPCPFDSSKMCLQSQGASNGTFKVKTTDCPEPVNISFRPSYGQGASVVSLRLVPGADVTLPETGETAALTVLADDASRTPLGIKGQFPIYIDITSSTMAQPATKELSVLVNMPALSTDCFGIGKAEYELATQASDSNEIKNYCYLANNDPEVPELSIGTDLVRIFMNTGSFTGDAFNFKWRAKADVFEELTKANNVVVEGNSTFVVRTGSNNNTDFEGDTVTPDPADLDHSIYSSISNVHKLRFASYYYTPNQSDILEDRNIAFIKDTKIELRLKNGAARTVNVPCTASNCTWAEAPAHNSQCPNNGPMSCIYAYFDITLSPEANIDTIGAHVYNRMNNSTVFFTVYGDLNIPKEERKEFHYTAYSQFRDASVIPGRDFEILLGELGFGLDEIMAQSPNDGNGIIKDINISVETDSSLADAWIVGNPADKKLYVYASYYGMKATLPVSGGTETIPFIVQNNGFPDEGYSVIDVKDYLRES